MLAFLYWLRISGRFCRWDLNREFVLVTSTLQPPCDWQYRVDGRLPARLSRQRSFALCPDSRNAFARAPLHHARRRFRVDRPPRPDATIATVAAYKPPRLVRRKTKPHVLPTFDCPVVAAHFAVASQVAKKHSSTRQQRLADKCLAIAGERSWRQRIGRRALDNLRVRGAAREKQGHQGGSHFITT